MGAVTRSAPKQIWKQRLGENRLNKNSFAVERTALYRTKRDRHAARNLTARTYWQAGKEWGKGRFLKEVKTMGILENAEKALLLAEQAQREYKPTIDWGEIFNPKWR